jgi:nucleoside-diphosphate-sugar epimerase
MYKIGVLGANGQVGAEVSLLLSMFDDATIIPISRSELGASFLRHCGLECRIGSVDGGDTSSQLLADCDVVADFSLPRGLGKQVWRTTKRIIQGAIRHAPSGAPYVYMSSTMAFGMPGSSTRYRNYLLSRTQYSAYKRRAERYARLCGLTYGRPVHIFRLGQVHGEIQGVSRQWRRVSSSEPVFLERKGQSPSDTVFCSTIALALVNVARGLDPPGQYTLLQSPEWTWAELYRFFAAQSGHVDLRGLGGTAAPARGIRAVLRRIVSLGLLALAPWKEILIAHTRLPAELEYRLKIRYLASKAAGEIAEAKGHLRREDRHIRGPVLGRRLASISRGQETAGLAEERLRALLEKRVGPDLRRTDLVQNFRMQGIVTSGM